MAAVYLHNAIHSRPLTENRDIIEHSRNLSAISCATLYTNTTLHSQTTTEPLLHPLSSPEATRPYYEHTSPELRDVYDLPSHLRWGDEHTGTHAFGEKDRAPGRRKRKPWRWRKVVRVVFQVVICLWAAYNTVRYFIAFTIYGREMTAGRNFSLGVGTSAGTSFVLAFCSLLLSALQNHLLDNGVINNQYLTYTCSAMQYLSSILLLAPAAVNFALLFIWKNSSNAHYNVDHRCHIDIDALWSPTSNPCTNKSPTWAIWLIVSSVRLAFTLFILLAYHMFSVFYPDSSRRSAHLRLSSRPVSFSPKETTPESRRPSLAMMLPYNDQDLHAQNIMSAISSDDMTLKGSPPASRIHLSRSRSSGFSGETGSGEHTGVGRSRPSLTEEGDRDQSGHMDRFRSLLSQITQETEEAVEYAQSDRAAVSENSREATIPNINPPSYSQGDDDESYDESVHDELHGSDENIFNLPPIPPALGYNEFGLPYPPEQDIRVLNGYIRRMPTIESMGSGEMGSSIGASSYRAGSMYSSSRPPTRNTLLSFSTGDIEGGESNPPSRANSLSARAEILAAMVSKNVVASEHGELLVRPETALGRRSTPSSFVESPVEGPPSDIHSSSGSRGTSISYHTATMGSTNVPPSPVDVPRSAFRPRENES
ncbi:hypothetical protein CPB84DRAFT_1778862 [Gymnopilus junonius]|uniref:Uncharacterized protein n=1 Tax=Gymnopilus junonius TaxID=109634 RepID=A0A9P5TMY2_GYMJU|nr:hypothetical protein CPB84DRAFT_1778862 [Gymnopilus junonius]